MHIQQSEITIYTDGSCSTSALVGAWASIILINGKEVCLSGVEKDTTHHRMELQAVIQSISYLKKEGHNLSCLKIVSDSQYVVDLVTRKDKLKIKNYLTNKGIAIRNADLVKILIDLIEQYSPQFTKIKSHDVNGDPHNRRVDMLARELIRKNLKEHG